MSLSSCLRLAREPGGALRSATRHHQGVELRQHRAALPWPSQSSRRRGSRGSGSATSSGMDRGRPSTTPCSRFFASASRVRCPINRRSNCANAAITFAITSRSAWSCPRRCRARPAPSPASGSAPSASRSRARSDSVDRASRPRARPHRRDRDDLAQHGCRAGMAQYAQFSRTRRRDGMAGGPDGTPFATRPSSRARSASPSGVPNRKSVSGAVRDRQT